MAERISSLRVQRLVAVLLVLLGGSLAYQPALDAGFLNLDDRDYVVGNPLIPGGLTLDSARWALTADVLEDSEYVDYWQPATLVSRLIDGSLYGLNPRGHHLTNIMIHLANAVLVLLLLAAATGRLWRSAVVALVFATHPLHVSSVAWVTERKDVLSAFFSLISLAIFARFAAAYREHLEDRSDGRTGGRVIGWYLLLAAGYALCLMSKPMTLPLPLVMLLVAFWPIARNRRPGLQRLAISLAPLLLLSALAIFLYTRVGVVRTEFDRMGGQAPLAFAARAVTSLAAYPVRLLVPVRLQHVYSVHPEELTSAKIASSLLLLGAVSVAAVTCSRRWPFLIAGWLWYLVSALPLLTTFQVSAAADRFSYFPVLGLTVIIVWGVCEVAGQHLPAVRTVAAAAIVTVLCLATRAECRYWQDSVTLSRRLLALDPDHDIALRSLGSTQLDAGENAKALESYEAALQVHPDNPTHYYNVGIALQRLGRLEEASRYHAEAIRHDPGDWLGYNGLGLALWGMGRTDEAEARFRQAVTVNPCFAAAQFNLGLILGKQGNYAGALVHFREALRIDPRDGEARSRVEAILERQSRVSGPPVDR